ncbi:hypothetical protein VP01_2094g3 [Puccinia sorghi]|uniref:Uncharacterized protein n=1 Tax=Puccinia sorghi TaxID=27349 RepID=A0A0L6VA86_9BASI|nr:hypothetical protein VP01_2094g3 [Puccinia sorghi]
MSLVDFELGDLAISGRLSSLTNYQHESGIPSKPFIPLKQVSLLAKGSERGYKMNSPHSYQSLNISTSIGFHFIGFRCTPHIRLNLPSFLYNFLFVLPLFTSSLNSVLSIFFLPNCLFSNLQSSNLDFFSFIPSNLIFSCNLFLLVQLPLFTQWLQLTVGNHRIMKFSWVLQWWSRCGRSVTGHWKIFNFWCNWLYMNVDFQDLKMQIHLGIGKTLFNVDKIFTSSYSPNLRYWVRILNSFGHILHIFFLCLKLLPCLDVVHGISKSCGKFCLKLAGACWYFIPWKISREIQDLTSNSSRHNQSPLEKHHSLNYLEIQTRNNPSSSMTFISSTSLVLQTSSTSIALLIYPSLNLILFALKPEIHLHPSLKLPFALLPTKFPLDYVGELHISVLCFTNFPISMLSLQDLPGVSPTGGLSSASAPFYIPHQRLKCLFAFDSRMSSSHWLSVACQFKIFRSEPEVRHMTIFQFQLCHSSITQDTTNPRLLVTFPRIIPLNNNSNQKKTTSMKATPMPNKATPNSRKSAPKRPATQQESKKKKGNDSSEDDAADTTEWNYNAFFGTGKATAFFCPSKDILKITTGFFTCNPPGLKVRPTKRPHNTRHGSHLQNTRCKDQLGFSFFKCNFQFSSQTFNTLKQNGIVYFSYDTPKKRQIYCIKPEISYLIFLNYAPSCVLKVKPIPGILGRLVGHTFTTGGSHTSTIQRVCDEKLTKRKKIGQIIICNLMIKLMSIILFSQLKKFHAFFSTSFSSPALLNIMFPSFLFFPHLKIYLYFFSHVYLDLIQSICLCGTLYGYMATTVLRQGWVALIDSWAELLTFLKMIFPICHLSILTYGHASKHAFQMVPLTKVELLPCLPSEHAIVCQITFLSDDHLNFFPTSFFFNQNRIHQYFSSPATTHLILGKSNLMSSCFFPMWPFLYLPHHPVCQAGTESISFPILAVY